MRFIPRWTRFISFGGIAAFGVGATFMGHPIEGSLIAILYLFPASLFLRDRLTTFVLVDEHGVSWREGRDRRALSWQRISGCRIERQKGKPPKLFLVESETLDSYEMPLFEIALFKAVARRRGRFRLQPARLGRSR